MSQTDRNGSGEPDLKIERLTMLDLQPGQVLSVHLAWEPTIEQATNMQQTFRSLVPGVKVIIAPPGVTYSAIDATTAAEAITAALSGSSLQPMDDPYKAAERRGGSVDGRDQS